MRSVSDMIRNLFDKYPEVIFTVPEMWMLFGKAMDKKSIQVNICRLKSDTYGFKTKPRLDLVNHADSKGKPAWGLRGAKVRFKNIDQLDKYERK